MRDPNPGIVLEVIDVIVGSGLAGQAKGLLLDTLKHADGGVRARCIEPYTRLRYGDARGAAASSKKTPNRRFEKAVLTRFVSAEDRSVVTYLTHILKSGEFFALSEDEQRELMEAMVHLSGERHIDLIVDKLNITEQSGISKLMRRANDAITDNITRRAAISALALMSTPKANAVIRDVKARSDLSLAAHCDVVLRLSQRDRSQQSSSADQKSDAPAFLEDISLGASRMGQAFVFTLDALGFDDVDGLKEQADARRMQGHDSSRVRDVAQAADSPEQAVEVVVDDAEELVDLGPNPLLGHHVVLDNWDRVKLVVRPAILEGERYTIVDAEASLVGVNQENIAVHVRRPTSLPPVRIVERSRVPKASPPPPEPVDSLLQAYLEGDVAENEPVETDDKRNLSELLNDYLDEPMTDTSPVKPGAPAFPDAPPPQILAPETRVTSDSLGGANVPDSDEVSADSQHAELDDLLASYIDSGEDK